MDNQEQQAGSPLLNKRHDMSVVAVQTDAVAVHRPQFMVVGNLLEEAARRIPIHDREEDNGPASNNKRISRLTRENFITTISAFYAQMLVVLGMAFPVTELLAPHVPGSFYQAFYLYLYLGSVAYICFLYFVFLKEKAVTNLIKRHRRTGVVCQCPVSNRNAVQYGSFYLRLGAIGFGIGSMVYSGLEIGQHFANSECDDLIYVFRPATRMLLTLLQIQFIFLNHKDMKMGEYVTVSKFGLMHMIATNLSEWLYVLVEETKHEIVHLTHHEHHEDVHHKHHEATNITEAVNDTLLHRTSRSISAPYDCSRNNIVGLLVQNASPFLFPCTIEYSLICAVTLYEMWKHLKMKPAPATTYHVCRNWSSNSLGTVRRGQHFSVDCHSAHKGLLVGILALVLTIIGLVLFMVLNQDPQYMDLAVFEVSLCEMALYSLCTMSVLTCMLRIRVLPQDIQKGLSLDSTLLVMAQAGMYVYCTFSIIGFYYEEDHTVPAGMVIEIIGLIQTTGQTMLVLDATSRRCRTKAHKKGKPGRQIITFLIVANMAMWMINTLEKGHAMFRPSHLELFGLWTWAIITHVSMPLAIFYRFHSTICLFEIWKSAYKLKPEN